MHYKPTHAGLLVAALVVGAWVTGTILLMQWQFSWTNPLVYVMIFVHMHLYTGLFITAHDAMHGTVSPNTTLNNFTGIVCTFLYAGFWYPWLYTKHHQHHRHVHSDQDPDYHQGSFWAWYFRFMRNYLSVWQIVWMAICLMY